MKLLILFFASCISAVAADITLLWDYPTNELSADLAFNVYASTNIVTPLTNWMLLTQVVGTATQARVTMTPAKKFFVVSASNLWGESLYSNITNTPAPVTNTGNLKITRP